MEISISSAHPSIHSRSSNEPLHKALYKLRDAEGDKGANSAREARSYGSSAGRIEHPFNMEVLDECIELSTYHAACQATLTSATIGGGLVVMLDEPEVDELTGEKNDIDEKATEALHEALEGLCDHSWDAVLWQLIEGWWRYGQSYLEVIRDENGEEIVGLESTPPSNVFRYLLSKKRRDYCFVYEPFGAIFGGTDTTNSVYFAKWRHRSKILDKNPEGIPSNELIDFIRATSSWEHYGKPHYLAAIPYIHVEGKMLQRVSDHMDNNGRPDGVLSISGAQAAPQVRADLENMMDGARGRNIGRSALVLLPQLFKDRGEIKFISMGSGLQDEDHSKLHETYTLAIASADQVPPVLAGITIPGKLGASNEQVQAMYTMQQATISPAQNYLAKRLNRTLFASIGGLKGFSNRKVRFKTWLEESDLDALNTLARQRETPAEAPDRKPEDGLQR